MRSIAVWILLIAGVAAPAADSPPVPRSVLDRLITDSLREVHNKGAELYNAGNPVDCYRLLQGSLLSTRPLLGHRPDVQKLIDDGLDDAERNPAMSKRAFMLHELVVKTRNALRSDDAPAPVPPRSTGVERLSKMPHEVIPSVKIDPPLPKVEPKVEPKKEPKVEPKVEPKQEPKVDPKRAVESNIGGKLVARGKPISGVSVLFVQLDVAAPRVGDAVTDADGSYMVKGLPAGNYAILINPTETTPPAVTKLIEAKYSLVPTTPLRAMFNGETQITLDITLQ